VSDISFVPLSWIKSEVEFSLGHARDGLARSRAAPEDPAPLVDARRHVHETAGAIRLIGLEGLAVFADELAALFEAALREAPPLPPETVALMERGVLALTQFLDDLQRGRPYVPLSLLGLFRELRSARSGAPAKPSELFYPILKVDLPPFTLPPIATAQALAPFVRGQCVAYQRGLVDVLRDAGNLRAFNYIRAALTALAGVSAELSVRALCWVASGYVDGLARRAILFDNTARAVLAQIEQQLRRLSAGDSVITAVLTRELLYELAVAAPQDGLIGEIKRRYHLHEHLPEAGLIQYDDARLRPLLGQAGQAIKASKGAWARTAAGDARAFVSFRAELARAAQVMAALGVPMLARLAEAINGVTTTIAAASREQRSAIALDMATALLLLEKTVAAYPELSIELAIQLEAMADRLQALASGRRPEQNAASAARLAAATRKAEEELVLAQVEREIRTSLADIEKVLDAYFRDPSRHDTLVPLVARMDQVRGALDMLELAPASLLLRACRSRVERLAAGAKAAPSVLEALADGFSALGGVVDAIRDAQVFPEAVVAGALARLEALAVIESAAQVTPASFAVPEPVPGSPAAAMTDSSVRRIQVERELLDLYLAEAGEVLAQVRGQLAAVRAIPHDVAALTAVRRGFHTLKGSGRTVGLADLGHAAWEVEQLLNEWLQDGLRVTPALDAYVEGARRQFEGWVATLATGAVPVIDIEGLAAGAEVVRVAGEAAQPDDVPDARGDMTRVGAIVLPSALYAIYVRETTELFSALQGGAIEYRAQRVVAPAFARAAHTLGSSSATAGFSAVQDIAHALEDVLREIEQQPDLGAYAACGLIEEGVARLGAMTDAIAQHRAPPVDEDLVVRLLTERERLHLLAEEGSQVSNTDRGAPVAAADVVDLQLLPIFLEEAADLLPEIAQDARAWQSAPADGAASASLARALHTLKGSARAAGLARLGELVHRTEDQVAAAVERGETDTAFFERLQRDADALADEIDRLRRRRPVPAPAVDAVEAPAVDAGLVLRVRATTVDRLVNHAGEIAIARSRIEREVGSVKGALLDLADGVERLRAQVRETELQAESQLQARLSLVQEHRETFDPLEFDRYTRLQELTRLMLESLHDITSVQQGLLANVDDADTALRQQLRMNRELQEDLMRARTMPFSSQAERMYRVVRQTALECGRRAHLAVRGGDVQIDRGVMERIGAPVEHLLRNAVVHGLETPAARVAAGKAPEGNLSVEVRQEAGEVVIGIEDDGGGLDLEAIIGRARAEGLLAPGEQVEGTRLAALIFTPGFTTAAALTESAGRGVGLDAVRAEIAAIGGRVDVESRPGAGTVFTLTLPISLAVVQGLHVVAGAHAVVVPTSLVQLVKEVRADEAGALYAAGTVEWAGEHYPVRDLPRLFDDAQDVAAGSTGYTSMLLLKSRNTRVALHVERVLGDAEFVVKSLGPQLAGLPWISGGTVLADGRVVLIVHPLTLLARMPAAPARAPAAAAVLEAQPEIMVVDDSLTVRTITGRLLTREGWRVVVAKDGVDALEKLGGATPALMVVDLEMPRMDGFDLIRSVRAMPRLAKVPIVVVTSRTADKHRRLALSLGANVFLGKPYQEQILLDHVRALIAQAPADRQTAPSFDEATEETALGAA